MKIPVPWVFVLAYLVGAIAERWWPTKRISMVPAAGGIGWALFGLGAVIAGWGLATFYRARTTTLPGETSSQLATWGPYRFTRNPMYVGLTLAYLGEAGLLRQTWPLALLPLVLAYLNWTVIPVEETKLLEAFGENYSTYKKMYVVGFERQVQALDDIAIDASMPIGATPSKSSPVATKCKARDNKQRQKSRFRHCVRQRCITRERFAKICLPVLVSTD